MSACSNDSIRAAAFALVAVLVFSSDSRGQEGEEAGQQATTLRVNTRLVQVDVTVRDDDGPVEGLRAGDFEVLDEGERREIEVFDVIRVGGKPVDILPEGVVSNRPEWHGRGPEVATVLLIDRLNTSVLHQSFADSQVREFLEDAARNNDRVAVYGLSESGLTVLEDFYSTAEAIRSALDSGRPEASLALSRSLVEADDGLDAELAAFTGEAASTAIERAVSRYYERSRARSTADALEAIVRRLAGMPGRKNLICLSSHFPFTFRPWQDPRFYGYDAPFNPPELDRIDRVGRMLADADVAVYPVYSAGLGEGEPARIDIPLDLASETGGLASVNSNGLATAMKRAVRDADVTYRLGFYVPEELEEEEEDSGFHALDIRVNREDVEVRHRRGYYGFGVESLPLEYPDLGEALSSPFDATSLGLLAKAEPSPEDPDRYDLAVIADVNDMGLAREGEAWVGGLEVVMYYYPLGAPEGLLFEPETHPVRLTDTLLETARATGFYLHRFVDIGARPGHLRIAVRDTVTGAVGSLWIPLGL
jgi:VWFA-related protein